MKGPYDDKLNLLETEVSNETQEKKIDSDTKLAMHKRKREVVVEREEENISV